jgi:hypothetical protein
VSLKCDDCAIGQEAGQSGVNAVYLLVRLITLKLERTWEIPLDIALLWSLRFPEGKGTTSYHLILNDVQVDAPR